MNRARVDNFDIKAPLLALTNEEIYILDDTFVRGAFFLFGTNTIGVFTSHVNEHLSGLIEEVTQDGINK